MNVLGDCIKCFLFVQLFEEGLNSYTWKTQESADFIELANAIVNVDLHTNLDIVQTNCHEITEITMSWSSGRHDVFSIRDHNRSYSIDELITLQRYVDDANINDNRYILFWVLPQLFMARFDQLDKIAIS